MLGGGDQAVQSSVNTVWSYERYGTNIRLDHETSRKIELAYSDGEATVCVSLDGEEFEIDLITKTGTVRQTGEHISLCRRWLGPSTDPAAGILFPETWVPMPHPNTTVHTVELSPGSSEYQDVISKVQATASTPINVQKIERIQNPHLYQTYMLRKQKMDRDNEAGMDNERQLFHGTRGQNVSRINAQGFNRSFCSVYGGALGRGVYFAKDASYSARFAVGGSGGRCMYLARVLVGQYTAHRTEYTGHMLSSLMNDMIMPPPKDPARPEILYDSIVNRSENPNVFVVFFDNQCYPEYLITFQ